jgi:TonB-linked SusC/RagA family outer membrane protein
MHVFTKIAVKKLLLIPVISVMPFALQAQIDSARTKIHKVQGGVKISGSIKDAATGKPLTGANIKSGTYSATISDDNGTFSLHVPNPSGIIHISAPGYQTMELPLKGRSKITVSLNDESLTSIYDQAVLPFGVTSKTQTPFAVVSINSNGNWERTAETPDNILQGQVSGLNTVRRSGTAGSGAEMFLRGFTSLNTRNQPLIVVDGMIYDTKEYGNSLIGGHVVNPLSNIDLKDIDNITVLKDGGGLYGTKGANGVVLINTAHAKQLATQIDFAAYSGINDRPSSLPVMGRDNYRLYLADLMLSAGMSGSAILAQPYMNRANVPNYRRYDYATQWQDLVFKNNLTQNYFMKITGGDNIARYALSMGYLNNNGVIDNTGLKRYNTRFNADLNLSKRLTAVTNLSFTNNEQTLKDQGRSFSTNPILLGLTKSPFLPVNLIDDEGVVSPNLADTDIFGRSNPMAVIEDGQQTNKNYRFFGSVKFDYAISKSWGLGSLLGLSYDKVRENTFMPRLGITPDTLSNAVAYSRLGSRVQRQYSLFNDSYVSYRHNYKNKHDVSAFVGARFSDVDTEDDTALGYNSPTDDFVSVGMGATALRRISGDIGKSRWLNSYLNVNYAHLSKYLLSFNLAADASSRFGREISGVPAFNGNKIALMPSVAAAWLVSSERFMASATQVDLLKLRLSYTVAGNDEIGNFSAREYYVSQNLLGNQGIVRGNIANPALKWETVRTLNAGVDFSVLNERLSLNIDVFNRKTSDMLTMQTLSTAAGFDYLIENGGSLKTKGIEIGANSRVINRSIKLDLGLNLGRYTNELTSAPVNNQITDFGGASTISLIGQSANQFYGHKTNGVYASTAEANASKTFVKVAGGALVPVKAGDVRFVNSFTADEYEEVNKVAVHKGYSIIDENDRQVIGNPNPDLFGGINGKLSYKRFSVSTYFTFSIGNDVYNGTRAMLESVSGTMNQTNSVLNRWTYEGQVTNVPRVSYGDPTGNSRFSDRWIEDGSYLRLRTLAVSYQIPVKQGFLKNATAYATGNNLFTLSKYLGYDPEFSATGSPLGQGVDVALEPQFRTVQLGIRVGL